MDELLERLEGMSRQELKAFLAERFAGEAPNSRATDLLRRRIAWRLAEVNGIEPMTSSEIFYSRRRSNGLIL